MEREISPLLIWIWRNASCYLNGDDDHFPRVKMGWGFEYPYLSSVIDVKKWTSTIFAIPLISKIYGTK